MSNDTFKSGNSRNLVGCSVALVVAGLIAWQVLDWTVNRIYVREGYSLMLRYKGPLLFGSRKMAASGQFARVDDRGNQEIGILEQMLGPGRHFYSPIWWERTLVEDRLVKPGEIGLVTSKLGQNLPKGQFLVDGDIGQTEFKGILRKVFGPGRYRINPYAYDFNILKTEAIRNGNQTKFSGWVSIPTGFVGVVTNLADDPETQQKAGIQQDVLPPGIYPCNPKEQLIDVVEIGYREMSIGVETRTDAQGNVMLDPSGEPLIADDNSGIAFPSNDGFTIHMDFTAIWGVMPDQAAAVIKNFGNVDAVETKIVVPQIESICRNQGSQLGAVELLVGESRQSFQVAVSDAFRDALKDKDVTLSYGLVRYIYIPQEVRLPIQQAFIADELKTTRDQEQLTAKTEANLREAEKKVMLETERIRVESEKLVAEVKATGEKTAAETEGETVKKVAEIAKQTAEIDAQITVLLGQADAAAAQLLEEAKADKFRLAVEAFGDGAAFNRWVFASGLPEDIKLQLLYAGDGTFWTDLKGFTDVMLGRQVQQSRTTTPQQVNPLPTIPRRDSEQ